MKRFASLFSLLVALRVSAAPTADTVEIFKMSTERTYVLCYARQLLKIILTVVLESIGARDEYTSLTKRIDTTCQNNPGQTASVDDAAACVSFLSNLGTTPCTINGQNVVFCRSGNAVIAGSNASGDIETISSFW